MKIDEMLEENLAVAEKYTQEMQKIGAYIAKDYGQSPKELIKAIHDRNIYLGRLTQMGMTLETWYAFAKAEMADQLEKPSEWRITLATDNTTFGKMWNWRERLARTISDQCDNIKTEIMENMSDRKHSGHQT